MQGKKESPLERRFSLDLQKFHPRHDRTRGG